MCDYITNKLSVSYEMNQAKREHTASQIRKTTNSISIIVLIVGFWTKANTIRDPWPLCILVMSNFNGFIQIFGTRIRICCLWITHLHLYIHLKYWLLLNTHGSFKISNIDYGLPFPSLLIHIQNNWEWTIVALNSSYEYSEDVWISYLTFYHKEIL